MRARTSNSQVLFHRAETSNSQVLTLRAGTPNSTNIDTKSWNSEVSSLRAGTLNHQVMALRSGTPDSQVLTLRAKTPKSLLSSPRAGTPTHNECTHSLSMNKLQIRTFFRFKLAAIKSVDIRPAVRVLNRTVLWLVWSVREKRNKTQMFGCCSFRQV